MKSAAEDTKKKTELDGEHDWSSYQFEKKIQSTLNAT